MLQERAAPPAAHPDPRPDSPPVRRRWRPFAGERRIWIAGGIVVGLFVTILVVSLLVPRPYYTGTNSTRLRAWVADPTAGQRLCIPGMSIPAGTGQIELAVSAAGPTEPRPRLLAHLLIGGRRVRAVDAGPLTRGIAGMRLDIPKTPARPAFRTATLCLSPQGAPLLVGGVPGLFAGDKPLRLQGQELPNRVSLWYHPPAGTRGSVLSQLSTIIHRATLFRPGWVGSWTFWLLLFALVPALIFFGIRLMARAARLPGRRIALTLGLLVFVNAAAWAVITPAFQAPDESEHFAYAQYFAETGHAIGSGSSASVYSTDEGFALDATRVLTSNELGNAKPPWDPRAQTLWRQRVDGARIVSRSDGGATSAATQAHSPLYYSLLAPAYWAASGGSIFDQLTAMRLMSALMGAIVAMCAFGIVLELLPRRRTIAAAIGLIVGFQPMFGFISGTVNNDSGVNMAAAVALYLLIRALRRGLTWRLAVATGAALAAVPIMKGTGYAIYPAALLGLVFLLLQERSRPRVARVAVLVASLAATYGVWAAVSASFHRSVITTPSGQAPGAGWTAFHQFGGYLAYLWEVFLPRLPFMADHWAKSWPAFDIYGVRGWGSFGWYAQTFDHWVYDVIVAAMLLVGAMAIAALLRHRRRIWPLLPAILVLLAAVTVNIAGVHAAYYSQDPHPVGQIPEMGRYVFPTITALGALVAAALFVLPRRWRAPAAAGLATAVMMTGLGAQFTELARFYFA